MDFFIRYFIIVLLDTLMLYFYITARPHAQFSSNLKVYISTIKKKIPDLQVGIDLNAKSLLQFSNPPLLDFNCLCSVVDFISINFMDFNPCNKESCGGSVPVKKTGNLHSMEQLEQEVISKTGIPKEKFFFDVNLNTDSPDLYSYDCEYTYQDMCTNPNSGKIICADTAHSLQEKGKFVSQYGGFIGGFIDLDDPDGCCKCSKSYPAFHYVLDGLSGNDKPEQCKMFDRTP